MKTRPLISIWILFLCGGIAHAGDGGPSVPQSLRGNSIEIIWKSSWTTKDVNTDRVYSDKAQQDFTYFYFSSAGRIFARRKIIKIDANGASLTTDAVDNRATGRIAYFSQITFDHNTMQAVRSIGKGDAMRLIINFANNFTSCAASPKYAKAAGRSTFIDPFGSHEIEVVSIDNGPASCSVRAGNIFE